MTTRRTARYAGEFGGNLIAGLDAISRSAVAGRWQETLSAADNIHYGTLRLREEAIIDALDAGADWWAIGQVLGIHPQASFDLYAELRHDIRTPAQQRPHLAVVYTAGLADAHYPCPEYGADIDHPTTVASIAPDPRVEQVVAAARLCGHHAWIKVTRANGQHAGDPFDGLDVLNRWISVLRDDAELFWLQKTLPPSGHESSPSATGRAGRR